MDIWGVSRSREMAGVSWTTTRVPAPAPATVWANGIGLAYLQKAARDRLNLFAALMGGCEDAEPGWISHALGDVGSEYRPNL